MSENGEAVIDTSLRNLTPMNSTIYIQMQPNSHNRGPL
jgi:hypothetical protein